MRVRADAAVNSAPIDVRRLRVHAGTAEALRVSLSGPLASVRSRRVTIDVASWRPPAPGWSGQLGPLPGVLRHDVRLPNGGPGPARVRVTLAQPLPFQLVGAAVLDVLTPTARLPLSVSPDVAAFGATPAWLPPGQNIAGLLADPPAEEVIRPYDLLLTGPDGSVASLPAKRSYSREDLRPSGSAVLFDATVTNPRGYRAIHDGDAFAQLVGGQLTIHADNESIVDGAIGPAAPLPSPLVAALRALRSIRIDAVDDHDPATVALRIVQLAATGVVVHTPTPLPGPVSALIAVELGEILAEPLPVPGDTSLDWSPTEWEARSVRQRRAALRSHASAWALLIAASIPDPVRTPSVSAIARCTDAAAVASAVSLVAEQSYPAVELVLICDTSTFDVSTLDSGPLPPDRLRVVPVSADEDVEVAYAAAVGRARGSLVTRLEPGAQYGREHVWDLVLARHYSGATMVGKACAFFATGPDAVVRTEPPTTSEAFVESLSDGPLLLARADLIAAGGWRLAAARPGYQTHSFGFVRPRPQPESPSHPPPQSPQVPAASRSATDSRTYPLMVATS